VAAATCGSLWQEWVESRHWRRCTKALSYSAPFVLA